MSSEPPVPRAQALQVEGKAALGTRMICSLKNMFPIKHLNFARTYFSTLFPALERNICQTSFSSSVIPLWAMASCLAASLSCAVLALLAARSASRSARRSSSRSLSFSSSASRRLEDYYNDHKITFYLKKSSKMRACFTLHLCQS